jgi:hypothetical protein
MSLKQSLIVAVALTLAPSIGCKKKSNTTEQTQSEGSAAAPGAAPGTSGSDTDPNQPNPTGAATGQPMGSAAVAPGAPTAPAILDGGVTDGGIADGGATK